MWTARTFPPPAHGIFFFLLIRNPNIENQPFWRTSPLYFFPTSPYHAFAYPKKRRRQNGSGDLDFFGVGEYGGKLPSGNASLSHNAKPRKSRIWYPYGTNQEPKRSLEMSRGQTMFGRPYPWEQDAPCQNFFPSEGNARRPSTIGQATP